MYFIYIDNSDDSYLYIHHPRRDGYKSISASVTFNLGSADTLDFSVSPSHPYYDKLFVGRNDVFLDARASTSGAQTRLGRFAITGVSVGWDRVKRVSCESALSFLNDTIMLPGTYTGEAGLTGSAYTESFLDKVVLSFSGQLYARGVSLSVRTVTVADSNNYISREVEESKSAYDFFKNSVTGSQLGGYLRIVPRGISVCYLDYLSLDSLPLCGQQIEFGKNLLSLEVEDISDDFFTVCYPIGKDGLTIKGGSASSGYTIINPDDSSNKIYIQKNDLVERYGTIYSIQKWEDVSVRANLIQKAQELLAMQGIPRTITVSAVDMSYTDPSIDPLDVGKLVRVVSAPHAVDETMQIEKKTVDLLHPASSALTLGKTQLTLSDIISNIELK